MFTVGTLAAALVVAAAALVVHHRIKHRNDAHLSAVEKFFQVSDVSNHETWVVALLVLAAGVVLGASLGAAVVTAAVPA